MASSRKGQAVVAIAVVAALGLFGLGAVSAQGAATRTFDTSTVAPGGTLVVTVAVLDYGGFGRVTETLPAGFTFVSSTHPEDQTGVDGNTLRFTLLGGGTTGFTYTVTAPTSEGTYTFAGMLRDADRMDHRIGGASEVTVGISTPTPTPEPTPTPTPSPTAEPSPTPAPTPTPRPTSTPTPTATPTAEPTPMPTATPAPTLTTTPTPSPTPTATPTRAPTATPTPVPAAASTATPTPSPTAGPTATPIPRVPVVPVDGGGGMPAWVIPVAVVAALLLLIAGVGVFITSRQR
ncbi:MAG: DUF11 domain-containing protein [Chloroflexi bacterium]|nr:DUF11 domain-containing protein [Chloroflexota bacterium]